MDRLIQRGLITVAAIAVAMGASSVSAASLEGMGAVRVQQAVAGSARLSDAHSYNHFGLDHERAAALPGLVGVPKEVAPMGLSPYWRTLHAGKGGRANLVLGSFSMSPRGSSLSGLSISPLKPKNDRGLIASYRRPLAGGELLIDATYLQSRRRLDGMQALNWNNAPRARLSSYNLGAAYRFGKRYSLGAGVFTTTGGFDARFNDPQQKFAAERGSQGYLLKADWAPVGKLRVGLQYTGYVRYDRGRAAYLNEPTGAGANNTLSLLVRTAF